MYDGLTQNNEGADLGLATDGVMYPQVKYVIKYVKAAAGVGG